MIFQATFFDGKTARAHEARCVFEDQRLTIEWRDQSIVYERRNYQISTGMEAGRCQIEFTDGARLEITDAKFTAEMLNQQHFHQRLPDKLMRRRSFALPALLISIGAIYLLLTYGVPLTAAAIAEIFPKKTEVLIGQQISEVSIADKMLFQPSGLLPEKQARLQERLRLLCATDRACPEYRLSFRHSPSFGANAFALPGGEIIMTDDLVTLAQSDDEIIAVLAHEMGHVKNRHSLRRMLESSLKALVLIGITGDVDSATSLLPALMFDLKYSRELETEADQFALDFMRRHCLPPDAFANIIERLNDHHDKQQNNDRIFSSMTSSHPHAADRARTFRQARLEGC